MHLTRLILFDSSGTWRGKVGRDHDARARLLRSTLGVISPLGAIGPLAGRARLRIVERESAAHGLREGCGFGVVGLGLFFFFFFFITLGLELSDTKVYEPGRGSGVSHLPGAKPVGPDEPALGWVAKSQPLPGAKSFERHLHSREGSYPLQQSCLTQSVFKVVL